MIVTATEIQTLVGARSGTRVATGIEIFHPNGTFTAHDSGTFTGTVGGRTGSITISGASSGTGNTDSGQIVGDQGTSGLAGLHLQGTARCAACTHGRMLASCSSRETTTSSPGCHVLARVLAS